MVELVSEVAIQRFSLRILTPLEIQRILFGLDDHLNFNQHNHTKKSSSFVITRAQLVEVVFEVAIQRFSLRILTPS